MNGSGSKLQNYRYNLIEIDANAALPDNLMVCVKDCLLSLVVPSDLPRILLFNSDCGVYLEFWIKRFYSAFVSITMFLCVTGENKNRDETILNEVCS